MTSFFALLICIAGFALAGILISLSEGSSTKAKPAAIKSNGNEQPEPVDIITKTAALPWDGGYCIYDPRYQCNPRLINLWDPIDRDTFRVEPGTLLGSYNSLKSLVSDALLDSAYHGEYNTWLAQAPKELLEEAEYIITKKPIKLIEREFVRIYTKAVVETEKARLGITCTRCGGTGSIPKYHYYLNGMCFKCGGYGKI